MQNLPASGIKADFIFNDGEHRIEKVITDFEAADLLLFTNGLTGIHSTYQRGEFF